MDRSEELRPDPQAKLQAQPDDAAFRQDVERLHRLTVMARWLVVAGLWITIGAFSLWSLRYPISLMHEYFTWASLRYGLAFNPVPAVGLALCIGMTVATLLWQSRNILLGLPERERKRLEQQVHKIYQQGASHPLWKLVRGKK